MATSSTDDEMIGHDEEERLLPTSVENPQYEEAQNTTSSDEEQAVYEDQEGGEGAENTNNVRNSEDAQELNRNTADEDQAQGQQAQQESGGQGAESTSERRSANSEILELPKDVYSLIYFKSIVENHDIDYGLIFAFVSLVFLFQALVLGMIFTEIYYSYHVEGKPWPDPPAGVDWEVRATQYFAIILSVIMQDDLIEAIGISSLLHAHSCQEEQVNQQDQPATSPHEQATIQQQQETERCSKWFCWVPWTMKFLVGTFSTIISVQIVIRSSRVIDLLANFAALYIVNMIDNATFILVEMGYLCSKWKKLAKDCIEVNDVEEANSCHGLLRRLALMFTLIMMFIPVIVVNIRQSRGDFLTRSFDAYVGDEFDFKQSYFNGAYVWDKPSRLSGRPVYREKGCNCDDQIKFSECSSCSVILYCAKIQRWVWGHESDEGGCSNFILKSPRTDSYDIMQTDLSGWIMVKNTSKQQKDEYIQPPTFVLFNNECREKTDCSGHGTCEHKMCICSAGYIGNRCESKVPCETLTTDLNTNGFPRHSNSYQLLRDEQNTVVTISNGRPVYYRKIQGEKHVVIDLILFIGSRWTLTVKSEDSFINLNVNNSSVSELAKYFASIHLSEYRFDAKFISQQDFGYNPQGLEWKQKFVSDTKHDGGAGSYGVITSIDSVLLCDGCSADADCNNKGECLNSSLPNSRCECYEGYHGVNCERESAFIKYSILMKYRNSFNEEDKLCRKCDGMRFDMTETSSESSYKRLFRNMIILHGESTSQCRGISMDIGLYDTDLKVYIFEALEETYEGGGFGASEDDDDDGGGGSFGGRWAVDDPDDYNISDYDDYDYDDHYDYDDDYNISEDDDDDGGGGSFGGRWAVDDDDYNIPDDDDDDDDHNKNDGDCGTLSMPHPFNNSLSIVPTHTIKIMRSPDEKPFHYEEVIMLYIDDKNNGGLEVIENAILNDECRGTVDFDYESVCAFTDFPGTPEKMIVMLEIDLI